MLPLMPPSGAEKKRFLDGFAALPCGKSIQKSMIKRAKPAPQSQPLLRVVLPAHENSQFRPHFWGATPGRLGNFGMKIAYNPLGGIYADSSQELS
ncbi:MAG: hypothetical protein EHM70_17625 [Chloroflexota bacterium]|nr:MAG: hypothetical protein EHM70_17625 [Chloroflexota bacterium]